MLRYPESFQKLSSALITPEDISRAVPFIWRNGRRYQLLNGIASQAANAQAGAGQYAAGQLRNMYPESLSASDKDSDRG